MLPAFDAAEYARRRDAILAAVETAGADAMAVTYELHVEYVTGTWGSQFWVAPAILAPGRPTRFVVREFERDRVLAEGRVADVETYFDRDDAIDVFARVLADMGLERARLGLELDNFGLTHRDVTELQRRLPELRIVDVSDVLPRVMTRKSEAELAVMRTAAARTRVAVEAFADNLHAGATERAVRAAMLAAVTSAGSEDLRGSVAFGRNSAIPHADAGDGGLARGDVAVTETSGYHLGYCATVCRTAVLGASADAEALYDVAREAVDAALGAMRPGAITGDVDAAARGVVERAGRGAAFRHRTGYSVGLRANGRLNWSLKPGATEVLEPGMTFHTPIILFEPGRFSVGCSETAVVTERGGEPLGTLDRELIRR